MGVLGLWAAVAESIGGVVMLWKPKKQDTDELLYSVVVVAGAVAAVFGCVKAGIELADTIAARGRPIQQTVVKLDVADDEEEGEKDG